MAFLITKPVHKHLAKVPGLILLPPHKHQRPSGILLSIIFLLIGFSSFSQEAIVQGRVLDNKSGESLAGVNIMIDSVSGTTTDQDGRFLLQTEEGKKKITFSFVGYTSHIRRANLHRGDSLKWEIIMKPESVQLRTAVVSASRYEQRLSDVTVSMEVIEPAIIENTQTYLVDEAINLMPGIDIIDGQANIRGGSGYSFGTGSRVMLLLNGLPMLTGDAGDVKWDFIPVENIGRIEIIKGASSALYGSSALNGVINVRTAWPGTKPETRIEVSGGMFMKPARKELSWWWDSNPLFGGMKFSHLRKIKNLDLVVGGDLYNTEGFREDNYKKFGRADLGLRYHSQKTPGLSYGFHSSIQFQKLSDFLIWQNADSGAFLPDPRSVTPLKGHRIRIDPFINYFDRSNGKHSLRGRFFQVDNRFDEDRDKNNASDHYFTEYQYTRQFRNKLNLAAGLVYAYTNGTAQLYGDHFGSTRAVFIQLDKRFLDRLSASLGFRWEQNSMDNKDREAKPVFRAGLNYRLKEHTFIRASYGQGYRYPSVAEKYTSTGLGALKIFPNPELRAETGWSSELGLRQGYRLGNWQGSIDIAAFITEYHNMMEFTFGIYKPDSIEIPSLEHVGFKSLNVGNARISGFEITINGEGHAGNNTFKYFVGYTYMDPINLNPDSTGNRILKYRYHHSAKGYFEMEKGKFSVSLNFSYHSFMERIDEAFEEKILGQEIFPGLKQYRKDHDQGAIVFDGSIAYRLTPSSKVAFMVKNLFNKEYMGRPGDIRPPRSVGVQYILKI